MGIKITNIDLPATPGIYRFYDETNQLIYVGKAKNLRRRIAQYRNAKRCKAHAKMRKIIREAKRMEHEVCETEFHALALEAQWIQQHRPKWNVAGAFYFLYPMIGVQMRDGVLYLCYTTTPEIFSNFASETTSGFQFSFHGAFRSRQRTREGFFALIELLRFIGHTIPRSQLAKQLRRSDALTKNTYLYGFRQIPVEWQKHLDTFLCGTDFKAIEDLSVLLLDHPGAVAKRTETEVRLHEIRRFWRHEILKLKKARKHSGWAQYPVSQKDRDLIFISLRSKGAFTHEQNHELLGL